MNTRIVKTEEGKCLNSDNQQVISCRKDCGRKTTMTGTQLCDQCWEEDRAEDRAEANMNNNNGDIKDA